MFFYSFPPPPDTFTCFPKLPIELRRRIYNHTFHSRVFIRGHGGEGLRRPSIVFTCKEAYDELHHKYRVYIPNEPAHIIRYSLLINVEKDIVYRKCKLPSIHFLGYSEELVSTVAASWAVAVKRLALDFDAALAMVLMNNPDIPSLKRKLELMCPNLEGFIIVYDPKRRQKLKNGGEVEERLDSYFFHKPTFEGVEYIRHTLKRNSHKWE